MKCSIRVGLVVLTLFFGCADEREPIPEGGARVDAAETGAIEAGAIEAGASVDASMDASRPDGPIDLFDVIPLPDGGCPGCIRDRCGSQINACINNPACAMGLFCTLQMCAGGLIGEAGFDPASYACVLACFNGDQNTAWMALSSFTCLTMTCGAVCNFLDAGADALPPNPDVLAPPDASADVQGQDRGADGPAPETGPGTDSSDNVDGDGSAPDADDDAGGNDAMPDAGNQLDTAPPTDATADEQPDQGGGAD